LKTVQFQEPEMRPSFKEVNSHLQAIVDS